MGGVSIRVSYFAAARDLAGVSEELLALDDGAHTVGDAFEAICKAHPKLAVYRGRLALAKNGEHCRVDDSIQDHDEISVLPPVAGGTNVVLAEVRDTPLSVDEAMNAVRHAGAGAVAVFLGTVRDHADGKSVASLSYEAHPALAPKELKRALEEVCAGYSDVRLAALHRVGHLAVGDVAVVVAASAAHRAEAFAACRRAIDRIKEIVPIWKQEFAADGSAEWVNFDPQS
ncbi:MAG: molybdenum cofactor biosynthesis protein MoaE [Sandaracinaceae bacterium]|jgi:molybdopterin converting factor subunit 1|nr:molybdenum cofactor biosynthesis protein MoaE [Sandaracinaceae bacterium]